MTPKLKENYFKARLARVFPKINQHPNFARKEVEQQLNKGQK